VPRRHCALVDQTPYRRNSGARRVSRENQVQVQSRLPATRRDSANGPQLRIDIFQAQGAKPSANFSEPPHYVTIRGDRNNARSGTRPSASLVAPMRKRLVGAHTDVRTRPPARMRPEGNVMREAPPWRDAYTRKMARPMTGVGDLKRRGGTILGRPSSTRRVDNHPLVRGSAKEATT